MKENELKERGIPKHIAIIMDGNGRWANQRGLPRNIGHRKGAMNLKDIALECDRLGVKYLTVYAFSTENWNRPKAEVDYIMNTPVKYFKRYKDKIAASNLRIKFIGRRDRFPAALLTAINEIEALTKDHKGLQLNIAADYGSRNELVHATKRIAEKIAKKEISIDEIDETIIADGLFTHEMDQLDLLIRTSGEQRISNFLLWQLSYAELYFTETFWPDFDKQELWKAIDSFQRRNRRFGGLKVEVKQL